MIWVIPLLLAIGGLLAVQAAANVQLSAAMRSPLGASTLQLAIALVLLVAATVIVGGGPTFGLLIGPPIWHLVGGIGSAVYITAGVLLFPRLGAVVTVAMFITGQMLASLALDSFGLLAVPVRPVQAAIPVGALAVLVGAGLVARAQRAATPALVGGAGTGAAHIVQSARGPGERAGWVAVGILGGAVLPVQAVVNAHLRADVGSATVVAAFSFLVATAAMAAVLAGVIRIGGATRPQLRPLRTVPWWAWSGGLVGAIYVTAMFLLVPQVGAAPAVGLTVAGQQLAGVAVDRYGLFRLPRRSVTSRRLAGVAVLLAGVGLLQLT